MDLELTGSRALITGATRGLGRAIAGRLAQEGCALAICARDAAALARTASELRADGATVHTGVVDVVDPEALAAFVADAGEALGGLDLVVANAGGAAGGGVLDEIAPGDWSRTFALNVEHAANVTRDALPLLRASDHAAVLFISSISGLRPQPRPQYAAAKAALIHLAASLGRELGPDGVRVNALSPGSILFEGGSWARRRDELPDRFTAFVEREFPLGRLGHAHEVADAAAFLLSRRAGWITGTNLVVDGGQNQPGMDGF